MVIPFVFHTMAPTRPLPIVNAAGGTGDGCIENNIVLGQVVCIVDRQRPWLWSTNDCREQIVDVVTRKGEHPEKIKLLSHGAPL